PSNILNALQLSTDKRYVEKIHVAGDQFQSSYIYINDAKFKPIGILNLPYFEDDSFNSMELKEFLLRLSIVYLFMFFIAIMMAYFVSTYITRSLKTISIKIDETRLSKRN